MGVAENFNQLCTNLAVDNVSDISTRYKAITKRLNTDFWNSDSELYHSNYVGCYGRGTAIRNFHDLDVLFQLPVSYYERFNNYIGNGQSALLQEVKTSLQRTYPNTNIGGNGQVVVVHFTDGMRFEILPSFLNKNDSYTFPDSNAGGSWKITNPFPEIAAVNDMNKACNYNLKMLCRMARAWRRKWDIEIGGLLIDTLAYSFISTWQYRDKSYLYYDFMSRDFFEFLSLRRTSQQYWLAPGSSQYVYRKGPFERKAKQSLDIVKEAINYDTQNMPYSASEKWTEVYGSFYP